MNEYIGVLRKYSVFSGRASRKEYWMFTLVNLVVYLLIAFISGFLGGIMQTNATTFIPLLYGLAVFIPSLAVVVRRLHDTSRSGFWFFIGLIPFIGPIIMIIFLVQDSKPGDNQYGPNPKGIQAPIATASPSQEQHSSEPQQPIQQ